MLEKEIAKLPCYSKRNANKLYRLSNTVYIDNRDGYGATPAHADIAGRGFVSKLDTKLAATLFPVADEEAIAKVVDHIKQGLGVAAPRVILDIEDFIAFTKKKSTVLDFDGADVVHALAALEVPCITIQIVLLGYSLRNIEDTSQFFNHLNSGVNMPDGSTFRGIVGKGC